MGHAIERFLIERGHDITCRIDAGNQDDFASEAFRSSDVAIEFTCPASAVGNYASAFSAGVPVVSGTTGWLANLDLVKAMIDEKGAALFWSSNFSIGVNLFMRVNSYLARIMNGFPQYAPAMKEIHHIHKLDHPSGTAITLAEGVIAANGRITRWEEPETHRLRCLRYRRENQPRDVRTGADLYRQESSDRKSHFPSYLRGYRSYR